MSQSPQPTPQNPEFQPTLFEMSELPEGAKRGWKLRVNGDEVSNVRHAGLANEKMGVSVEYGQRPEGYDGFIIHEPGGAATIPYMIDEDGAIYIGLVKEFRPTMGEKETSNIPRGFSDFGEDKATTAKRELSEETGLDVSKLGGRMIQLAQGKNPNSTFFDYSSSKEAGVGFFAVELMPNELDIQSDDEGNVFYAFPEAVREQVKGDGPAEKITGSVFVPLEVALQSRDMFTSAATGHLLSYLLQQGQYIVPQNNIAKTAVNS